jgi:hypothetical protein
MNVSSLVLLEIRIGDKSPITQLTIVRAQECFV